jgi:hypothetical protein
MRHKSLNQLLCAALVNNQFRELLLSEPAVAIDSGFLDNHFHLSPDEFNFIVNIHSSSLENMADQVHNYIQKVDMPEPTSKTARNLPVSQLNKVSQPQILIKSNSYSIGESKKFEEVLKL